MYMYLMWHQRMCNCRRCSFGLLGLRQCSLRISVFKCSTLLRVIVVSC